jgi:hypothetical protein
METSQNPTPPEESQKLAAERALPAPAQSLDLELQQMTPAQRRAMVWVIIVFVLLVVLTILSIVFLMNQPYGQVARIRDIFIIFLAIQSLLIGLALVILMIQLARLINLLQNEIKPILDSTNETVSNLRGTTTFLSDSLVGPVIKLNEYMAGITQLLMTVGLVRKPPKNQ